MLEQPFILQYPSTMEKPNLDYIYQLSEGDKDFEAKLISVLKKELPDEIEELKKSIKEMDFQRSAENVHKLKHKISIFGFRNAYEEANTFENELKFSQDLSRLDSFLAVLESMTDFLRPL